MTVGDLQNILLRLEMASKGADSEFVFDSGREGESPFVITGVHLDDDGDVCLECDMHVSNSLSASELARALDSYDDSLTVYFVTIASDGVEDLYNIKDGGTKDRYSSDLRKIPAGELREALERVSRGGAEGGAGAMGSEGAEGSVGGCSLEATPYFESGTINFTINSIYFDSDGCLVLESNEIDELDNYTVGLLLDELSQVPAATPVYLYDDDSHDFYGIYPEECRLSPSLDPWFKVR